MRHPRHDILGVVLAGGRSSRMGQNKALMKYKGKPMVQHMLDTLSDLGTDRQIISGHVEGYEGIEDDTPLSGPVGAIIGITKRFRSDHGYLFVPVDMPLLDVDFLSLLLRHEEGACFEAHPLPVYLPGKSKISGFQGTRVKEFIKFMGVSMIKPSNKQQYQLTNVNTPEEWEKVSCL